VAILQESGAKQLLFLRALHLFGRSLWRADTVLDQADVSLIHASIRWNGKSWLLFDHSRNGTFIDQKVVVPNGSVEISEGKTIHFGSDRRRSWTVINLDPPRPLLLPLDSLHQPISLRELHFLPSVDEPEVMIFLDDGGQWLWEDDTGIYELRDGDVLTLGRHSWRYINGMSAEETVKLDVGLAREPVKILFCFDVSQNEEHVELRIQTGRGEAVLGERSHHYSILTLARQRLLDAQRGFDVRSQGWLATERLAEMLRLEPKHLNMQLHRARHQISTALPAERCWERFIERRRGELRFGDFSFQIIRGSRLEARFDPLQTVPG